MRIARLDLIAFGAFTGEVLDFGPPSRGLQVVYGRNAAGKSTSLRAVLDLLFGIPERTKDDFEHEKSKLRVGAELVAADGRRLAVVRRKGRSNTLLDPATGQAIADALLDAMLGGIGRAQFAATFGLGHEGLRRGADDLLKAGGALGATLFDAASGTRSVRAVLDELDGEASRIFAPRATTATLNAAIRAHQDALARSREGLRPDAFEERESRCRELGDAIAASDRTLAELRSEQSRLARIGRNLPRVVERERLCAALDALGDVPDLPADAARERLETVAKLAELQREIDAAEASDARLAGEIAALHVPEELLAQAGAIAALVRRCGAIEKADEDLPRRRADLAGARGRARQMLDSARRGLAIEQALAIRPEAPRERRIAELAKARAGVDADLLKATEQCQRAERLLAEARRAHDALPPRRDLAGLVSCIDGVAGLADVDERIRAAEARVATLQRGCSSALAALPSFGGSLDDLARLVVPLPATVRTFEAQLRDAAGSLARARERAAEAHAEHERLREQRAELRTAGDVPSVAALDEARAHRQRAWDLVRRAYVDGREDVAREAAALDPRRTLPEAYEEAVRRADELGDAILADADRVARDRDLARREGLAMDRVGARQAEVELALAALAAAEAEWRAPWTAIGIDARSPAEMLEWLERRREIVERRDEAQDEEAALGALAAQRAAACAGLAATLDGCAIEHASDASLAAMLQNARAAVEHAAAAERRRGEAALLVESRAGDLHDAEERARVAQQRLERWTAEWREATASLGLQPDASPSEVEEFLRCVREAVTQHLAADELAHRIAAMQEDQRQFAADVAVLVDRLDPSLAERGPLRALKELEARLASARTHSTRLEEKQRQLDGIRTRLATLRAERHTAEQRLAAILARARAATPEEAEQAEQRADARRRGEGELQRVEREMIADGNGQTLEGILAEASELDGDALAARRGHVDARIEDIERERVDLITRRAEARRDLDELRRRDAVAASAAQDAADALVVVRREALQYARLRLSAQVLRDFVERHRQRHEGPLLARARELFRTLTRGTFAGLRTDYDDDDEPIVVGVTPSGAARRVEQMSDGTRDQLYLALRVAAVEQHALQAEPLPFVADDLLVNFDDDRARAALTILAELGRTTQVLFFTHHRHLVELAREVVPHEVLGVQELRGDGLQGRAAAAGVGVAAD